MMKKTITIIVAAAENDAIGINNDLIWSLPNDLKRFKKLTSGHCIIMGRKTFDSFPGLLPNRKHIVISKKSDCYFPKEVCVVNNFEDAIKATNEDENPYVIGGGQIYKLAMEISDKIEITRVHEKFEADTFFPKISENKWELINEEFNEKDEKHKFSYTYKTYLKIK
jgi:dihydrofolate reductase